MSVGTAGDGAGASAVGKRGGRGVGAAWIAVAALALVALVGARLYAAHRLGVVSHLREPLPELMALPDFHLVDQDGRPVQTSDLDGKVWVADFVFTRCTSVCPLITERMHKVADFADQHARFRSRIGLLSITVDPADDTPPRLKAWGAEHHIDTTRWRLLTGPSSAVEDVVVRGFKLAMGKPETDPSTGRFEILHGTHLVLVDGLRDHPTIRGYYDSDADGVARIERDLGRLLDEEDLRHSGSAPATTPNAIAPSENRP